MNFLVAIAAALLFVGSTTTYGANRRATRAYTQRHPSYDFMELDMHGKPVKQGYDSDTASESTDSLSESSDFDNIDPSDSIHNIDFDYRPLFEDLSEKSPTHDLVSLIKKHPYKLGTISTLLALLGISIAEYKYRGDKSVVKKAIEALIPCKKDQKKLLSLEQQA